MENEAEKWEVTTENGVRCILRYFGGCCTLEAMPIEDQH